MKHASLVVLALALAGCNSKGTEAAGAKPAAEGGGAGASLGSSLGTPGSGAESRGPGDSKARPAELADSIDYYDGAAKRKLWVSDELVAEFGPSDAGRDAILGTDPAAKEIEQPQKGARIWRLSGALRGESFAKRTSSASIRISPVLHEGPSGALPMRALPGGVLATFNPDWNRERIDTWLAARNLKVEGEPVAAAANLFLVGTAPGLDSVRIANELHETGELADAAPNFWLQNVAR